MNLLDLPEEVFFRVLDNYEQDEIEQKPRLSMPNEEARGDFTRIAAGLGNSGGGWIAFGPHAPSEWSSALDKVYDPSSLSNSLAAIQPAPRLAVHLRDTARGRFVLLKIEEWMDGPRDGPTLYSQYADGGAAQEADTTRVAHESRAQGEFAKNSQYRKQHRLRENSVLRM